MSFQDFQQQAQGGAPQGVGIGQMTVQMLQQRMRQLQQQQQQAASMQPMGGRTDFNPDPGGAPTSMPGMAAPSPMMGGWPGGASPSPAPMSPPPPQMGAIPGMGFASQAPPMSPGPQMAQPQPATMPPGGMPPMMPAPQGAPAQQAVDPEYQRGLQLGALLRAMQLG